MTYFSDRQKLRRKMYGEAAAKAMLFNGRYAYKERALIQQHLPAGEIAPHSREELHRLTGGKKRCLEILRAGWLVSDEAVAPWTPGFILGLRRSGALVEIREKGSSRPGRMKVWLLDRSSKRGWLAADLGSAAPAYCRVIDRPWLGSDGRKVTDFPVAELPCSDEESLQVLAGVVAGAKLVEKEGVWWLRVSPRCLGFLGSWGVPCESRARNGLVLSPFWGALMSGMMPPRLRMGFEALSKERKIRIGQCPELPGALWQMAIDDGWKGMPGSGVLPFGVKGRDWLESRKVKELPGIAMERWGLTRVRPEVRGLLLEWIGRAV
jgi:hypothetical protein